MLLKSERRILAQPNVALSLQVMQDVDTVGRHGRGVVAGAGFEPAAFRL